MQSLKESLRNCDELRGQLQWQGCPFCFKFFPSRIHRVDHGSPRTRPPPPVFGRDKTDRKSSCWCVVVRDTTKVVSQKEKSDEPNIHARFLLIAHHREREQKNLGNTDLDSTPAASTIFYRFFVAQRLFKYQIVYSDSLGVSQSAVSRTLRSIARLSLSLNSATFTGLEM